MTQIHEATLSSLSSLYPFTKTFPNYPHKNNADNSIKIAFTNSGLPKIIRTLFTNGHLKKNLEKTDERAGGKGTMGDLWPRLGNYPHYFGIAFTNPESGPDADIMRIIAASKKCGLFWFRLDFTTK